MVSLVQEKIKMVKARFTDGVHSITNEQYNSSEGISRSQLMLMNQSPYHFWYGVVSGLAAKKEATPAMVIGSAFHTLLLEPHLFEYEYCIKPELYKMPPELRLKDFGRELFEENKKERAEIKEKNSIINEEFERLSAGKIVLTREQYTKTKAMADGVRIHESVTLLLSDAQYEQSIYWTDKDTGLQFKVRPDVWSTKMCVDIKTAADVATYKFKSACLEHGYYLQAGMIYEACKAIGQPIEIFSHLVIEKEAPYAPKVFVMSDKALQFGIDQFMVLKERLAECYAKNKWEAYRVEELDISEYAVNQLENEL